MHAAVFHVHLNVYRWKIHIQVLQLCAHKNQCEAKKTTLWRFIWNERLCSLMMKTSIKIALCHLICMNKTLAVTHQRHLCKWVYLKLQNYQNTPTCPQKIAHQLCLKSLCACSTKVPTEVSHPWLDFLIILHHTDLTKKGANALNQPHTLNSLNVVRSNSNIPYGT